MKGGAIADAKDRLAHTLYCMGEVQEIRGKYPEALKLFSDALQLRLESDATRSVNRINMVHCAMALCGIGNVHMRRGEFNDAKLGFQEAVKYLEGHGVPEEHELFRMVKSRLKAAVDEKPLLGCSSWSDESTESGPSPKKSDRATELEKKCQEQMEAKDYDEAIKTLAAALAIRRRKLTKKQKAGLASSPVSNGRTVYLKEREAVADTLGMFALVLSRKGETKQASMLIKEAIRMHTTNGFADDHESVKKLKQQLEDNCVTI